MIQPTELRLGNYVNVPRAEQSPFRIDGFEYISKDGGKIYQNNGTYETSFGTFPFHPLTWEISDLAPIPLTPEILEKAGFKHQDILKKVYHKNVYLWNRFRIDETGTGKYFYGQLEITSLHQLQNLYFALVGSELTVNL